MSGHFCHTSAKIAQSALRKYWKAKKTSRLMRLLPPLLKGRLMSEGSLGQAANTGFGGFAEGKRRPGESSGSGVFFAKQQITHLLTKKRGVAFGDRRKSQQRPFLFSGSGHRTQQLCKKRF